MSFDHKETDPFTIPNGRKLNNLYADDLVLVSKSKFGLEKCLKTLESFTDSWRLDINLKKTKVMIFQNSGRKQKD